MAYAQRTDLQVEVASAATATKRDTAPPTVVLQRRLGNRAAAHMLTAPSCRGLPPGLRAEAERRSGVRLGDVRVHHESPMPRQLGALAYARGSEIYLGPGQERHLAHETWHVVQQRRGQVAARSQVGGHALNEDAALETDADNFAGGHATTLLPGAGEHASPVTQLLKERVADHGQTNHVAWGDATNNHVVCDGARRPVLIEVMEYAVNSAKTKVAQIANSKQGVHDYRAILIAFNGKAAESDQIEKRLKKKIDLDDYEAVVDGAAEIAAYMESRSVLGGCYPFVWSPTEGEAGYVFPFLEARARVTLHAASQALIQQMGGNPVIRSMDGDVSNDPMLNNRITEGQRDTFDSLYGGTVLTGGYSWDGSAKPAEFWGLDNPQENVLGALNTKLAQCILSINHAEHFIRGWLNDNHGSRLVYWPEPNLYSDAQTRRSGAESALDKGQNIGNSTQQRESTYYIKDLNSLFGTYDPTLTTVKPLKDYFGGLTALIVSSQTKQIEKNPIATFVAEIRQTHLNPDNVLEKIRRWNGSTEVLQSSKAITKSIDKIAVALVNKLYGILRP